MLWFNLCGPKSIFEIIKHDFGSINHEPYFWID